MTVMSQLSTLESAGLIRLAQFEPDLEYLFRHTLVQDAAYATLLTADRKRQHQVVGEAIEHLYPDRLNEYAAMLARHFEQAGNNRHALEYFSRAGDTALASRNGRHSLPDNRGCRVSTVSKSSGRQNSRLAVLVMNIRSASKFQRSPAPPAVSSTNTPIR